MKLLMIADDFTGALDAGVQFAKKGFSTRVLVYGKEGFGKIENVDVLVVDTETRHKSPQEAYQIVYQIVKLAAERKVKYPVSYTHLHVVILFKHLNTIQTGIKEEKK